MVRAPTVAALRAGFTRLGLPARLAPPEDAADHPDDALEGWWAKVDRGVTFPVQVGASVPWGAFGPLDYLANNAPDVRSAVEVLARDFALMTDALSLEVRKSETLHISLTAPTGYPRASEMGAFIFAGIVSRLQGRAERPLTTTSLALTHPVDVARASTLLRVPVRRGPVDVLSIGTGDASTRLVGADPALLRTMESLTEARIGRSRVPDPLEQARAALRERLARDPSPDLATLSRQLACAPRTLQRRLRAAGTTFSALLDDVRRAEAGVLLARPDLQIQEVAERLGFAHQASFARAFRRWTGSNPRDWRRTGGTRTEREDRD